MDVHYSQNPPLQTVQLKFPVAGPRGLITSWLWTLAAAVMLSAVVFGHHVWVARFGVAKFSLVGSEVGPEYKRRQYFMTHALDLFGTGSRMFPDKIWQATSDSVELIVVPPKFAD
ncbi:cytochrome P450 [Colletotrichum tabaci]|uniref:Cytochrome P450 n=1 Tax=Colletotrichum tabaci TaxID=1209068 RepID=A0AAV9THB8_9PEZI